jgi:hypothetical protein
MSLPLLPYDSALAQANTGNPKGSEFVCGRPDIFFCEDWEDGDHVGWDWESNWACGGGEWEACISNTGGVGSPNALRLRVTEDVPDTAYPGNSAAIPAIDASSPIFLRWYLRYSPGYVFMKGYGDGQKILYMRGIRSDGNWQNLVGAQGKNDDTSVWQLTQSTHNHNNVRLHNGAAPRWMTSDQWYCIEWEMKCNTAVGAKDGYSRIWVNDQLYMEHLSSDMDCGDATFDTMVDDVPWISSYYGGNPGPPHPEQSVWYDNIVGGRSRIGCTALEPPVEPPPVDNFHRTDLE